MSLHKEIRVVLKGWHIYLTDLKKGRRLTYSQMTLFKALEALKCSLKNICKTWLALSAHRSCSSALIKAFLHQKYLYMYIYSLIF